MIVPKDFTMAKIEIAEDEDREDGTIYGVLENIHRNTLGNSIPMVSHFSLAISDRVIYTLIRNRELGKSYTKISDEDAKSIQLYKLKLIGGFHMIIKEDGKYQEAIDLHGSQAWLKNGKLHRDNDLPAIIKADGEKLWYKNGKRHRDNDLPAAIWKDGTQVYYKNDRLHRDNDLPAVIYPDGTKEWYKNDKQHRDNDLPAIIYFDGSKEWYKNGMPYKKK